MPHVSGVVLSTEVYSRIASVDQRRRDVMRLYLKQTPQHVIAEKLGTTQQTISQDILAVRELWQTQAIADYTELKHRELNKVDLLELTYWEAWEKSLTQKTRQVKKSSKRENVVSQALTQETQDTPGDPRFLEGVRWCIDKRCQILGLNAPTKNLNLNVSVMSDEELDQELRRYGLHE